MDKSLFVSMGGASNAMRQLAIITNNLANVNTTAYRSDSSYVGQFHVSDKGAQTRVYGKLERTFTNFDKGSMLNTERDLDIALDGDGFIAVQSKSGKEGYTRSGSFELQDGVLMTKSGSLVLGNGGSINIPQAEKVHISSDGTISAKFVGAPEFVTVDRIKLVNPPTSKLQKGIDGLFYLTDGTTATQDTGVKILTGALEGSNVNAIDTMTQLIDLSRHYEIHTNFMKTTADNTSKANQILALSR